jgi:hypothetical protein
MRELNKKHYFKMKRKIRNYLIGITPIVVFLGVLSYIIKISFFLSYFYIITILVTPFLIGLCVWFCVWWFMRCIE